MHSVHAIASTKSHRLFLANYIVVVLQTSLKGCLVSLRVDTYRDINWKSPLACWMVSRPSYILVEKGVANPLRFGHLNNRNTLDGSQRCPCFKVPL